MYLTKITLSNAEAYRLKLYDPYQWHKALWNCFRATNRPYLFRVDKGDGAITFLMLSVLQPKFQTWGLWQTKEIPAGFYEKDRYVYSLRTFPSVKVHRPDETGERPKQGKRIPRLDAEQWLIERAEDRGFSIETVQVNRKETQVASKGRHVVVDFEGILTVTDREKFLDTVRRGMGPSKAYGLGLLLLKPVQ